ncbi:hypothetical protein EYF80_026017 [Liparis tanakae]|uniref:Uncharacterized protein n=1 Tax=Liparis tanakae TaxID=230148 RepID=A0A4Z2HEU0_9TELE|nr:hypothetical protein EYF80_026017 [Liparis tanakae]
MDGERNEPLTSGAPGPEPPCGVTGDSSFETDAKRPEREQRAACRKGKETPDVSLLDLPLHPRAKSARVAGAMTRKYKLLKSGVFR